MENKKVLSTKAILMYVLAAILIVIGVLFATPLTTDLFGINFDQVMIGVVLFLGGIYLLTPRIKKEKKYKWLIIVELVILILISFLVFILPPFVKELGEGLTNPNIYIGALLIMHSSIHLFLERIGSEKLVWYLFFVNLFLIAFGGFILDSKVLNMTVLINVMVVILFVIVGLYVGYKGYKMPKVIKEVKVIEEKQD